MFLTSLVFVKTRDSDPMATGRLPQVLDLGLANASNTGRPSSVPALRELIFAWLLRTRLWSLRAFTGSSDLVSPSRRARSQGIFPSSAAQPRGLVLERWRKKIHFPATPTATRIAGGWTFFTSPFRLPRFPYPLRLVRAKIESRQEARSLSPPFRRDTPTRGPHGVAQTAAPKAFPHESAIYAPSELEDRDGDLQ